MSQTVIPALPLDDASLGMSALGQKRTSAPTRKYFGFGDENDFVVFDGARVVGRIFLHPRSLPMDSPWFWTITAPDTPPLINKQGCSATRKDALADFKARWLS